MWTTFFLYIFEWLRKLFERGPTFEELAREILEGKKLRAPGTAALAKIVISRLIRYFGKQRISQVSETAWREYVLLRQKEKPGCKLFDDKKLMTQVIGLAHRRGLVERKIHLSIPDRPSSVGREITPTELRRLRKHASMELRFQIDIAYKMGLRRKELLSLRWELFEWNRRVIVVYSTKTKRTRDVPINADLFEKFRRRYRRSNSPCVFPGRFDPAKPMLDNKTAWIACKRRASVKARWQDLRHTCATVMIRRGVSVKATSQILGNSEKVCSRIYAHLNSKDLHRANAVMCDRPRARRRKLAA